MVKDDRNKKLLSIALSKLKRNKLAIGTDLLDEILMIDPDNTVALLARGSVALKLGNAKKAKSDFSRILDIDPNHLKAQYLRGIARPMEGDNHGESGDFSRATEIDPTYRAAYCSRAIVLTSMGQHLKVSEDIKIIDQDDIIDVQTTVSENDIWYSHQPRFENIIENEVDS